MRHSRSLAQDRRSLARFRRYRHSGGSPAAPMPGDPNDPRGFPVLVERYLEHRGLRGFSVQTIASNRIVLRLFARWAVERGLERPAEVSRDALERYQRWLFHYRRENGKPLGFGTQKQRLVWVAGFFRWLARERYVVYNPASELELPKTPKHLPVHGLSLPEIERVLAAIDVATLRGVRDRAIVESLYSTGMRRGELSGLDLYDVDFERGWVTIRQGKGAKDRVVPIGSRALAWIRKYLDEVRPELALSAGEPALFLSTTGERIPATSLTLLVRRLFVAASVTKKGSCHLFRHAMATLMLERGADIRYIQEILGHSTLETTQAYTKVSIQKLKEIHEATHPGAKLARRAAGASSVPAADLLVALDQEAEDELESGAQAN